MTLRALMAIALGLALGLGCGGTASPSGLEEPLRVRGGAFKRGELPGTPASEPGEEDEQAGPRVTTLEPASVVLIPGQVNKVLPGRASDDAYSIGLRLEGVGSGYWVIPLGAPDATFPGELSFRAQLELSPELPAGEQVLQVVAFDAKGHAGAQVAFPLCAVRPYDRTLNACDAKVPPPGAVISLSWNVDVDLDLIVRTPSGKLVDAAHPSTAELEDDQALDPEAPGVGVLERDSNAGCELDSVRRESLVFSSSPEPGEYLVYVSLFEACGRSAARFEVESYARVRGELEDTFDLVPWGDSLSGIALGINANGGTKLGTYVGSVKFTSP